MGEIPKIIEFEKIVEPHLNNAKILSYSCKFLTKPGENYGSVMLSVNAEIQNADGTKENLPLVAKLPPITNEMFWKFFKPEVTCVTEISVYVRLSPAIEKLQKDAGIREEKIVNIFPKCYGARLSLNATANTVDRDAVLVLENLQANRYKAGKRTKMFDYEHTKFILEKLAAYHALPIALRILHPKQFKTDILPHFGRFNFEDNVDKETTESLNNKVFEAVENVTNKDENLLNKIKKLFEYASKYMANPNECEDGLFTTIAHYDFWINNMMMQYDENGKLSGMKIVDFQIAQYESLMHDVIFFLLASVEIDVIENNYMELLHHYYSCFIETLKSVHCPITDYNFTNFMKEVNRIAPIQLPHVFMMLKVLLVEEEQLPDDMSKIDTDFFTSNESNNDNYLKRLSEIIRLSKMFGFFDDF